ncbi:MAG: tetratricopeptide repeat protein [Candidatus Rokubacteria bacterium]|nr:tetratricopeptide repeat protein [Candidatus Rokubacteria bacterium]
MLELALQLDPTSRRVLDAVAAFHAAEQSFERLRDRMLAIVAQHADCALAHLYLGAALCRLGMASAGQDACARAARLSRGSALCYLGLARACRQAGDLEGSIDAYRRVLEIKSDHPLALFELAEVYNEAGLPALCTSQCTRLLLVCGDKGSMARKARELLARASGRQGVRGPARLDLETRMTKCLDERKWAEARAHAEALLRVDPCYLPALLAAATVAAQSDDTATASRLLHTAVQRHPASASAHAAMARFHEQQADPENARAEAYRALALEPANPDVALLVAAMLLRDGQLDTAKTLLTDCMAAGADTDEKVRCELARILERQGDAAGAVKTLAEPPVQTANALGELARLLAVAGNWPAAARIHRKLLASGPGQAAAAARFAASCLGAGQRPIAVALGRELARRGEAPLSLLLEMCDTAPPGQADPGLIALLESALTHLPLAVTTRERVSLHVSLARQLVRSGRHEQARASLEDALQLDPSDATALDELADQLVSQRKFPVMREIFGQLADRTPASSRCWLHLAEARLRLDEALAAQDAAARAVGLDAGCFEARLALARASRATKDYERAIAEYRQALRLRPNDPRTLYELAAAYGASNLHELARGQWARLVKVAPEGSQMAKVAWNFLRRARA